jgi:hypothetical protein
MKNQTILNILVIPKYKLMKKLFLFFILLFTNMAVFAQSWNCFTPGNEQFFTNNYGFIKGMRIDSITGSGSNFVYHPFRTIRVPVATYSTLGPIDSSGGSWLGKNVIAKTDGTFLFDNIWGDTIKIKTKGTIGGSWIFYDDGTDHYYEATITSLDTMSILGVPDSVKRITLTAYQNGIYAPNDSFDNAEIILSKSGGFVQVPDLYNFPYHEPDTAYSILKLDYIYYMSIANPYYYLTNVNWGFSIDMSVVPGK